MTMNTSKLQAGENGFTTGKAIVIGGSIAGLLAARVLSDFYEEVLIVERDELPESPSERQGTPQAIHPHRFTERGKKITNRLFPGYEDDLLAGGALPVFNKRLHNGNQYGSLDVQNPRHDYKFSRALLEWAFRNQVKKLANVRIQVKQEVTGLLMNEDRSRVTGIRLREKGWGGAESTWNADLVVDTSGRGSKLTPWLEAAGYEVPRPDLLKVALGYSTRRYKVPAHLNHLMETWDTINIAGQPAKGTFTGVFSFIENGVAEMLLYRPGGQYPPVEAEAYEREIAGLPTPLIDSIVRQLEPLAPPRGFRVPELYRRRYDRMEKWPSGLLALGDAICIYDPIFGQGMTVAAIQAEVLEATLRERQSVPEEGFELHVLRRLQDVIEPAWWLNCANDLQWEGVEYEGAEPLKAISFASRYISLLLQQGTTQNQKLYGLYWAVNTLSVTPEEMLRFDTVMPILNATAEGKQLLDELVREYGEHLEAMWDQIVPSFSRLPYEPFAPQKSGE
ncbi:FAD dependent oxidoreductase [Paenibacillus doosanensis]|uniref:FAD-dependent oxidoreductase n=1 Tax=Paenibacillus doosanensis TaxID=1229154 RepID=UPI00217FB959|nr:FAD dependent oxidoreductase [Paenibacillus doosanensis]MCS7458883.1 FAD dependent oxidoreductase [Paenibacillus doosanensis]